jgi:hypothetical protein
MNNNNMIQVIYRGKTISVPFTESTLIKDVKETLTSHDNSSEEEGLKSQDVKLIYKGKILDNDVPIHTLLVPTNAKKTKPLRLLATGISSKETNQLQQELSMSKRNNPRIRDDLSSTGKQELVARQRLSRQIMNKVSSKYDTTSTRNSNHYGFARIETLPMLPQQDTAKQILHDLANDPGILACMNKHQWNVGCLKEMYPEGKVGESEVCYLGLNRNKGQEILLRLRTDDLKGFRKILSIRKVLFHELAHNVYSEHDSNFFQLNRQIEKECNELDWRRHTGHVLGGDGLPLGNTIFSSDTLEALDDKVYGGTFRLGRGSDDTVLHNEQHLSKRELAAKAALMRMSKEEESITFACGCTSSTHEEKNPRGNDELHKDESKE